MDRTNYFNKNRIVYISYTYTQQMFTQHVISCVNFPFLADNSAKKICNMYSFWQCSKLAYEYSETRDNTGKEPRETQVIQLLQKLSILQ